MGLLGLLSLLQAIVVPGCLLLSWFGRSLPRLDRWLLTLPASLVINYCLVVILTTLGLYSRSVMLGVFAAEILLLAIRWRTFSNERLWPTELRLALTPINVVLALLVVALLAGAFKQVGTVFVDGDAVLSWDRWAEDWSRGNFAQNAFYYPQLLPTLYSLTYCFLGTTEVKLFAKLLPAFIVLANVVTWLRAAWLLPEYRRELLLGFIVFSFAVARMMGSSFPFNGYADYPLMYLTVVLGYGFILLSQRIGQEHLRLLTLLSLIVAGAAVTKQSGVFLAAIFPLAWYVHLGRRLFDVGVCIRQLAVIGVILALVGASWYVAKYLDISHGADQSNLSFLAQLTPVPYSQRIPYGAGMLARKLSWLWLPAFLVGMASPLARPLALWIGFPFFVLWAWFVPYDYRNVALALPALSIAMAAGLLRIGGWLAGFSRLRRFLPYASLMLACLLAYKLTVPEVEAGLREISLQAARRIGKVGLNERLYALFEYHPKGTLLTVDAVPMKLPDIGGRMAFSECSDISQRSQDEDVRWLLTGYWCSQASHDALKRLERNGLLRMVFVESGYTLYEKMPLQDRVAN